jgi:hypothetical protein
MKIALLRSVSLDIFKQVLSDLIENISAQKNSITIIVQNNIEIANILNEKLKIKKITPGKLSFFKAIFEFNFGIYDKVIIPVQSYEIENFKNILSYSVTLLAKEYIIIYPDSFEIKISFFELVNKIIQCSLSNIFIKIICLKNKIKN